VSARLAACAVVLVGCARADAQGFRFVPGSWSVERVVAGDAAAGFGAAVAFAEDRTPWVGAPWQGPGRVFHGDAVFLEGVDGDFLGTSLLGGPDLLVGAPGRSAVMGIDGGVVLQGEAERWAGGAVVRSGAGVAALGRGGVVGEGAFDVGERLWSLVTAELDGRSSTVIAGVASGGVAWRDGRAVADGALGRGLAACDLDGDGDDDLALADPIAGRVAVFVVDRAADLDLARPDRVHDLGPGAGRSLACVRGGLLIGAPERSPAGVAWLERPLADGEAAWIEASAARSSLGFSLAVGQGRAAAGDPGRGEVWVLRPRRGR
jgi:hypothetical protein